VVVKVWYRSHYKRNIHQWQTNYNQKREETSLSLTQESLFLAEKQRLLAELITIISMKEFEKIIKAKSTRSKTNSKEESNQFNPYDMFN